MVRSLVCSSVTTVGTCRVQTYRIYEGNWLAYLQIITHSHIFWKTFRIELNKYRVVYRSRISNKNVLQNQAPPPHTYKFGVVSVYTKLVNFT